MTDYTKTVNFAAKDTLPSGDSGKIIRGTEFETEFDNISTAIATKADLESPTFTGTATIPTAVITTFTLGGVTVTASGTELNYLDITTLGTVEPSKVVTAASNGNVQFLDSEKLTFGTSNDLSIFHDGSNSYIDDSGTGNLLIRADDSITLKSFSGTGVNYLQAVNGGEVRLYHNNNLKLATKSTGVTVTGTLVADEISGTVVTDGLSLGDSEKAQFGDGNDLQIYHDGSNSFIEDAGTGNLNIKSNGNGVVIKDGSDNNLIAGLHATGEAKLWHVSGGTATERLITTSTGVRVDGEFTLNNNGTNIYATSSAFASASPFVDVKSDEASDTASTTVAVIRGPGTTSAAVARTAGIALKISNETSTTESKKGYDIYTTSSSTFGNNPSFHIDYADGTKRFSAAESGESYLYYNDSEKLATSTNGVSVTGVTDTDQLRVTTPTVPSSASDTGTAGDIAWDADYIYVCTATDTWKRVAISTWS